MIQQVSDLDRVDLDFGCSTVCPVLLGLMRDRQNGQTRWARFPEHPNQSQPNPGPGPAESVNHPETLFYQTEPPCAFDHGSVVLKTKIDSIPRNESCNCIRDEILNKLAIWSIHYLSQSTTSSSPSLSTAPMLSLSSSSLAVLVPQWKRSRFSSLDTLVRWLCSSLK